MVRAALKFVCMANGRDNALDVVDDLIVPESDYAIALGLQVLCSFCIQCCLPQVLTPVQFPGLSVQDRQ